MGIRLSHMKRYAKILVAWIVLTSATAGDLSAQVPVELEVRQIVTFSFLPGKSADAISIYRDQVTPLYEKVEAMLSFRGFREIESPVPFDLIAVSAFDGMAGMDDSNAMLRTVALEASHELIDNLTALRREVIAASIQELSVR